MSYRLTHDFVLEYCHQICTLVQYRIEMLCRSRYRDIGYTTDTLVEDVFKRISSAIKAYQNVY